MNEITLSAHAKINLGLDITGIRDDGYHLVDMVMQTVTLADRVTVKKNGTRDIKLTSTAENIPLDDHNLAYKAAKLMAEISLQDLGVDIHIEKNIPVAAGLAGGSTDAAAVMVAIDRLFKLGIEKEKLMEMGVKLGADVPYCIHGGTARAQGIGEVITGLPKLPGCFILLAKPPVPVSTRDVYMRYDSLKDVRHPDIDGMIDAITAGNLKVMAEKTSNVLELVTAPMHPVIGDIERIMTENGAVCTMMSGSGPTVFGLFTDREKLMTAKHDIDESGLCSDNTVCEPIAEIY